MIFTLKNEQIESFNETGRYTFPKYTSQLINWANQNAQGTRPRVVGQMSDLFPEFLSSQKQVALAYWKKWYLERHPEALKEASDRIYAQVEKLREAIQLIDYQMVENWVEDLLINKTYNGLYVQKAILASLADIKKEDYRLATPEEEAKGIDGFVGETAYSVKPSTYKTMDFLPEVIDVKMVYYTKTKVGMRIEVEE